MSEFKFYRLFSKETEYAIRGLVYIQIQNLRERRAGIFEIAGEIGAPQPFTAKILQRLVRLGFVESLKGKGGGFYFDQDKPQVSLKELIIAIEGDNLFSGCAIGLNFCDLNNPCPAHDRFAPIKDAINDLVSVVTIQELANKKFLNDNLALKSRPKR